MVHVGVNWTGGERDGGAYSAPLRHWVPSAPPLANELAAQVRSLQPGWSRQDVVVGAYQAACRHIGLDPASGRPTALTPTESALYKAKLRLPDRTLALGVEGLDDPRDLVEVGVRLAGIDARNATLVTGGRPDDPGIHRLSDTLLDGANEVAVPVMASLNTRLGHDVRRDVPAAAHEM